MSLKINYAKFSAVFALPQLSEQTLCTASAEALRLLLYLMQNQPQVIDPRYLADRLMIPYQQVLDGLDFWCREGLLCHQEQPVEQTCQPQPQPEAIQQPQPKTRREPAVSVGLQAQKKTMSIDEIDHLSQQDANISQLVEMVQMQMGKALTRTEIETLVSFYTYAGLPPEYILLAVSFFSQRYSLNNIKSKTVGDGQHGTARWATPKEIRSTYHVVPAASGRTAHRDRSRPPLASTTAS